MSHDYPVPYFPPKGTKYKWYPPALTNLGWAYVVETLGWAQSLILSVDRGARGYYGHLYFNPINGGKAVTKKTRYYKTPLPALRAIEKAGDELLKADTQPWMKRALKMGWRPPA